MTRAQHDRMANAIRALAMDAVEQAKSGHPGLPMGAADIATVLFTQFLKFDPADPTWPDRDRFVLSAGHGSMLLYALLHLLGYEAMTIDEIKNFRQLGSQTPGHPENFITAGRRDHHRPARPGHRQRRRHGDRRAPSRRRVRRRLVDHRTYVLASDGDLMEGISQEAIALAGHLKLSKLDRAVRRQRHLDRRPAVAFGLGRSGEALRGCRLERLTRSTATIREAIAAAIEKAKTSDQPDADRLQDHHRLRRADQGRQGELARLAARRRRNQGRPRKARLERRAVRDSGRRPRRNGAPPVSARRPHAQAWDKRLAALPTDKRSRIRAPHARRSAGRAERRRPRGKGNARQGAEGDRDAAPPANSRWRASFRRCRR